MSNRFWCSLSILRNHITTYCFVQILFTENREQNSRITFKNVSSLFCTLLACHFHVITNECSSILDQSNSIKSKSGHISINSCPFLIGIKSIIIFEFKKKIVFDLSKTTRRDRKMDEKVRELNKSQTIVTVQAIEESVVCNPNYKYSQVIEEPISFFEYFLITRSTSNKLTKKLACHKSWHKDSLFGAI